MQQCAAAVDAEYDDRGVQFGDIDRPNCCVGVTLCNSESGFSERKTQYVALFCADGENRQPSLAVEYARLVQAE